MAASKEPSQSLETNADSTPPTLEATTDPATDQQTATDDTTTEMPPGGKPRSNTIKRDADLSSLLNPGEKTELTALVTKATESMLKHVAELFDPVRADPDAQSSRTTFWSKLPYHLRDVSLNDPLKGTQASSWAVPKENVKPARSKKAGRARDKRDAARRAADAPSPSQEETDAAPRLQELKKEALLHFKKWQMAVHRRIGEISVKKGADPQAGPGSSGPKGRPSSNRRGGKAGGTTQHTRPSPFNPLTVR
jgi:hypothetical protein